MRNMFLAWRLSVNRESISRKYFISKEFASLFKPQKIKLPRDMSSQPLLWRNTIPQIVSPPLKVNKGSRCMNGHDKRSYWKAPVFFSVPGDFSLHIFPVELEDDGTYQCQASPTNDGQPALRSRFAKLSVLVPPQKPKILQGDFLITTEDRELVIECVSVGGKPPAEVSRTPPFLLLVLNID